MHNSQLDIKQNPVKHLTCARVDPGDYVWDRESNMEDSGDSSDDETIADDVIVAGWFRYGEEL
jgi:hypothetical protein